MLNQLERRCNVYSKSAWDAGIASEALALKKTAMPSLKGIKLKPLAPELKERAFSYNQVHVALSPDALSAMEANLRFNVPESLATKIFGRLSACQNWVFIRENAKEAWVQ